MKKVFLVVSLILGTAGASNTLPPIIEGKNGWIFFSEELLPDSDIRDNYSEQTKAIQQVVKLFKSQGIEVFLAIIPSKASVYSEFLPENFSPSFDYKSNYNKILRDLSALHINTIDLKGPMVADKKDNKMFFKTDTHWTPQAAQLSGKAIAESVLKYLKSSPVVEFNTTKRASASFQGDLTKGLSPEKQKNYAEEVQFPIGITPISSDLLSDVPLPDATLIGTSYSDWGDGFLSRAIAVEAKRDVLNFASSGHGFWEPLEKYVQSSEYKQHPPKVLIIEMPERYLRITFPRNTFPVPSFPWLEEQITRGKNNCSGDFSKCNKKTDIMSYVFNWKKIDFMSSTGIYKTTASGFFDREGNARHAGPEKTQITFWLRQPEKIKLNYSLVSAVGAQTVQVYLNGKLVKNLNLAADISQADTLTLQGGAGQNLLEFRYSNWNTKTTTFASGDTRKIAVTFSQFELKK